MFDIHEELKKLPDKPGCYLMKDDSDNIIYIGKAKVLKNRVRSYFQNSSNQTLKVIRMVPHIKSFEYIVTDSEVEALILECNLIKKHHPKYNILLKDDKAFPYIKVTVNEAFPRVFSTRLLRKDKAKYFGPFTDVSAVRETITLVHKLWKVRKCTRNLPKEIGRERPCLNYHIGQCSAPCNSHISSGDYVTMVQEIMDLLDGKHTELIKRMKAEMQAASDNMEFERAASLRDKINSITQIQEKQKITNASGMEDQDVVAFARSSDETLVQVFFIRSGKMIGREHFLLTGTDEQETEAAVLANFIKQFYSGTAFIPKEIILQSTPDECEVISQWLSEVRGSKVSITVPQKGEKEKLVELAAKNALLTLQQFGEQMIREQKRSKGAVEEIMNLLGLDTQLVRIEAYDISNIQGFESVGSMVVFENGKPKRTDYRKFKIKTVVGPNDYKSMEEVIYRRFSHGLKEADELTAAGKKIEDGKFTRLPDLIMMDGGKIQISAAKSSLQQLGLKIPVCGMIKDDNHRTRGLFYEDSEITAPYTSEGFKLITRIQDEVHRFAIEYHRSLRSKSQTRSILDDIPGIGSTRRKALIKAFGSVDNIRLATLEELAEVSGMNKAVAETVYNFFRQV